MSNGRGKNKAKHARRDKKVSKGIHGATKHPLTEVQKVLLGKGAYASFVPIGTHRNYTNKKEKK
jgi:hypothetical protein